MLNEIESINYFKYFQSYTSYNRQERQAWTGITIIKSIMQSQCNKLLNWEKKPEIIMFFFVCVSMSCMSCVYTMNGFVVQRTVHTRKAEEILWREIKFFQPFFYFFRLFFFVRKDVGLWSFSCSFNCLSYIQCGSLNDDLELYWAFFLADFIF